MYTYGCSVYVETLPRYVGMHRTYTYIHTSGVYQKSVHDIVYDTLLQINTTSTVQYSGYVYTYLNTPHILAVSYLTTSVALNT